MANKKPSAAKKKIALKKASRPPMKLKKSSTKPPIKAKAPTKKVTLKKAKAIVAPKKPKTASAAASQKKLIKKNEKKAKTASPFKKPSALKTTPSSKPLAKKKLTSSAPVASSKKATTPRVVISKQASPSSKKTVPSPEKAALLLKARHRPTAPAFIKNRQRKSTPIFFSLEEVQSFLKQQPSEQQQHHTTQPTKLSKTKAPKTKVAELPKTKASTHQAASLADILGFNPKEKKKNPWKEQDEARIPKKFLSYFKNLIKLRDHVQAGLELHSQETLKRSSKEDSGDLSGYGQHIADAGTDTFDRDFALGLVSSEQDLLFEIDEAIQRICDGSYGVCEITGKPISHERLVAVPFARFSLDGQKEYEATHRPIPQRSNTGGIFSEAELESGRSYRDDDDSDN